MIATHEPTETGPAGRAWDRSDVEPGTLDQTATVGAWIVNLPGSHPFWPTYLFCVVHLRTLGAGVRPPVLNYPEAQYELAVVALNPDGSPGHPLNVDDRESWAHLVPVNIVEQFDFGLGPNVEQRDALAAELLRWVVRSALCGYRGVEPDDDGGCRDWWREAIRNTSDHLLGLHEDPPLDEDPPR